MKIIVILGLFIVLAKEAGWIIASYQSICGFMALVVGACILVPYVMTILFALLMYHTMKKGTEHGRNNKNI